MITETQIMQIARRFIDDGEQRGSTAEVEFRDLLCNISAIFDYDEERITAYIAAPIRHATLSANILLQRFSMSLQAVSASGISLPEPSQINRGSYRALFQDDITRVQNYAIEVVQNEVAAHRRPNDASLRHRMS